MKRTMKTPQFPSKQTPIPIHLCLSSNQKHLFQNYSVHINLIKKCIFIELEFGVELTSCVISSSCLTFSYKDSNSSHLCSSWLFSSSRTNPYWADWIFSLLAVSNSLVNRSISAFNCSTGEDIFRFFDSMTDFLDSNLFCFQKILSRFFVNLWNESKGLLYKLHSHSLLLIHTQNSFIPKTKKNENSNKIKLFFFSSQ